MTESSFEFIGDPVGTAALVAGDLGSGSFVVEYAEAGALRGALLASRTPEERDAYRPRPTGGV
jgi:hypothetical protein